MPSRARWICFEFSNLWKEASSFAKALMRRLVNRSVVTDTAFLFSVRIALIRTLDGSAFDPVHVRFRRGMLLSSARTHFWS